MFDADLGLHFAPLRPMPSTKPALGPLELGDDVDVSARTGRLRTSRRSATLREGRDGTRSR